MGVYYWIVNFDRREFLHASRVFDHGNKYGDWNYGKRPTMTDALLYLLDDPESSDHWRGWWNGQRVALVNDHGCIGGFTEMISEQAEDARRGVACPGREDPPWHNISREVVEQMKLGDEEWWGTDDGGGQPVDYNDWLLIGSDGQYRWHRKAEPSNGP